MTPPPELLFLLEYRLHAVATGRHALQRSSVWDVIPDMKIYFNEIQVIEGKATGFTNGAIEAAVIHCRALLEFLGLGLKRGSSITLRELDKPQDPDDIWIAQIDTLSKVTTSMALSSYQGPALEAEAALAYVIYLANKGLAHTSRAFTKLDEGTRLLEIAFLIVPVIVLNSFYVPLGMEPPDHQLPSRSRDADPTH